MPVTGRHEQPHKALDGRVAGGVTAEDIVRRLVTQYGTPSKDRNSHG